MRSTACFLLILTPLALGCGSSHAADAGPLDAGCSGYVYCSPAFGICCTDSSYDARCIDGEWSCDFPPPDGFGGLSSSDVMLNSECRGDAMSLIQFEGLGVANAFCWATGPIDAGAGDPACGAERPTCSELFGRCCTQILSAATCTDGAWTCDANYTLTSECSLGLAEALRGDYGAQRAFDFCYPSVDAGTVDAGTVDAGTVDAGTVDAGATDASP